MHIQVTVPDCELLDYGRSPYVVGFVR